MFSPPSRGSDELHLPRAGTCQTTANTRSERATRLRILLGELALTRLMQPPQLFGCQPLQCHLAPRDHRGEPPLRPRQLLLAKLVRGADAALGVFERNPLSSST
jgi:hypothetical protein